MRGYEQMRNGAVLHGLPVRIVGVGGGYAYGHAGPTHHALEDITIFRAQPGMAVVVPADPAQTRSAVRASATFDGPMYLRVGKGGNTEVPGLRGRFALGRPEVVKSGDDVVFVATGEIVHEALAASRLLERDGVSAAVAVLAHVSRFPTPELVDLLRDFGAVVTVEEGYPTGGLGALVAEAMATNGIRAPLSIRGVGGGFDGRSGDPSYMRRQQALDSFGLADAARGMLVRSAAL
jgi:transketolase